MAWFSTLGKIKAKGWFRLTGRKKWALPAAGQSVSLRPKSLVHVGTGLAAATIAVLAVALTFTSEHAVAQSTLPQGMMSGYAGRNEWYYSGSRTAIYDIAARTVYLPDGRQLEAHSGWGIHSDDPRYINVKGRGPTPPNVYNLMLREQLFHGDLAIRLIPADDGKMFGRDGILAHSYLRGPSGQSHGCVAFRNYPAFLNAFLRGKVNRLVVVDHLPTTTDAGARGYATY
jgi:hypothetical protein